MKRSIVAASLLAGLLFGSAYAQTEKQDELRYVVIVSRHGVRAPTGKLDSLNQYSRQSWPKWSVPAGNLTPHGAALMQMFGAYDRAFYASAGLLAASGCADAARVHVYADSDQRTQATGHALIAGMMPGCDVSYAAKPEGTEDPIFHPANKVDAALADAALNGRIGGEPQALAMAYHAQLEEFESVLHACPANDAACAAKQTKSVFDVPTSIDAGKLNSPLGVASTMTENFLLEYTDGMDDADVAWGQLDGGQSGGTRLRSLLALHVAQEDITLRTPTLARAQSSSLLERVRRSMAQAVTGHPVAGSLDVPNDKMLILVGHDTNLASVAGNLQLNWLIDGRRDDTPPGGALVFELWRDRVTGAESVRTFYTAQTLEQMRNRTPLTLAAPPERVPVFVPACGRSDGACSAESFLKALDAVIDKGAVE